MPHHDHRRRRRRRGGENRISKSAWPSSEEDERCSSARSRVTKQRVSATRRRLFDQRTSPIRKEHKASVIPTGNEGNVFQSTSKIIERPQELSEYSLEDDYILDEPDTSDYDDWVSSRGSIEGEEASSWKVSSQMITNRKRSHCVFHGVSEENTSDMVSISKRTKEQHGVRSETRRPVLGHFEVSYEGKQQYFALIEGIIGGLQEACEGIRSQEYLQSVLLNRNSEALPRRGRILELPGHAMSGRWNAKILCGGRNPGIELCLRSTLSDLVGTRIVYRHQDFECTGPLSIGVNDQICPSPPNSTLYTVSRMDPSTNRKHDLFFKRIVGKREFTNHPVAMGSISLVAYNGFSTVDEAQMLNKATASSILQSCRDRLRSESSVDLRGFISVPTGVGEATNRGLQFVCKFGLAETEYCVLVGRNKMDSIVAVDVVFEPPIESPMPISPAAGEHLYRRVPLTAKVRKRHTEATRAAKLPSPFQRFFRGTKRHNPHSTSTQGSSGTKVRITKPGPESPVPLSPFHRRVPRESSRIEIKSSSGASAVHAKSFKGSDVSDTTSQGKRWANLSNRTSPASSVETYESFGLPEIEAQHKFIQDFSGATVVGRMEPPQDTWVQNKENLPPGPVSQVTGPSNKRLRTCHNHNKPASLVAKPGNDPKVVFVSPTPLTDEKTSSSRLCGSAEVFTPANQHNHTRLNRILFTTPTPILEILERTESDPVENLDRHDHYDGGDNDDSSTTVTWAGYLVDGGSVSPFQKRKELKHGPSALSSCLLFLTVLFLCLVPVDDPTTVCVGAACLDKVSDPSIQVPWIDFREATVEDPFGDNVDAEVRVIEQPSVLWRQTFGW